MSNPLLKMFSHPLNPLNPLFKAFNPLPKMAVQDRRLSAIIDGRML
jgi:hypothetical protein